MKKILRRIRERYKAWWSRKKYERRLRRTPWHKLTYEEQRYMLDLPHGSGMDDVLNIVAIVIGLAAIAITIAKSLLKL